MMIAETSSAFWPPTSSDLILASPMAPKPGMNDPAPLSRFASLPTRVLSNDVGAPVSKMSRYGPLPLTFTSTAMWPDFSSSNGTVTGLAAGVVSALAAATSSSRKSDCRMSDALRRREGDLFCHILALDGQRHLRAGRHAPRQPQHVGD